VQFQCFAAGVLLCLVLCGRLPQLQIWQRFILLTGSLACWFSASRWLHYPFYSAARNPGSWHLIAAYALGSTGSVLIVVAFLGLNPKLIPAWAIYLGRISFGLYVFHLAVLDSVFGIFPNAGRHHVFPYLLKISLALGLTVLAAGLSYRFLETPFLKMKKRHAIIESQPV